MHQELQEFQQTTPSEIASVSRYESQTKILYIHKYISPQMHSYSLHCHAPYMHVRILLLRVLSVGVYSWTYSLPPSASDSMSADSLLLPALRLCPEVPSDNR